MPNIKTTRSKGRPRLYGTELPVYDSMEQAASATGIPLNALKIAKKQGCLFIRHGRVDLGEFIKWWFKPKDDTEGGGDDHVNWTMRDKRASALLKEVKLEEENGRLVDFSSVSSILQKVVAVGFFGELSRLTAEYPATLKGKTEMEIQSECQKQEKEIITSAQEMIDEWINSKGKS